MFTEEKKILLVMSNRWHISLYKIYKENLYSVAQIDRVVLKYQKKMYFIVIGQYLIKTPIGYFKLNKNREKLYYTNSNDKYWDKIPKDFVEDNKTEINKPYTSIDRRSLISISGMKSSQ